MVAGILPSQLQILTMGQTYFETIKLAENNQSAGLWFEGWINTRTSREPTYLLL